MSRFSDLFSNVDVPQEPVTQQPVVEEVKVEEVEEVKVEEVVEEPKVEPVAEVFPPKPLQNVARPPLRRTRK